MTKTTNTHRQVNIHRNICMFSTYIFIRTYTYMHNMYIHVYVYVYIYPHMGIHKRKASDALNYILS